MAESNQQMQNMMKAMGEISEKSSVVQTNLATAEESAAASEELSIDDDVCLGAAGALKCSEYRKKPG